MSRRHQHRSLPVRDPVACALGGPRVACAAVVALITLAWASPRTLAAQGKLRGDGGSGIGATYDTWRFGGAGLAQPTTDGSASVRVTGASQWTLPISARVPIARGWTMDLTSTYAHGVVQLEGTDKGTGTDRYTLSGPADTRLRLTGRLVGDNVLLTVGANAPTGKTSLTPEELSALRVLGAPALSFQAPVLGMGGSGTLGLVLARQIAGWAWALGSSYEMRTKYTPIVLAADLPVDLSPGNVLHLSAGADGLIGQHGMTFGVSADVFGQDLVGMPSETNATGATATSRLGPIFTGDWQLHVASDRFREFTLYAVDRYRTAFTRAGVVGSSGNYLDFGARTVTPLTAATGLLVTVNGRHQTGLRSDSTLSTAAMASGALTLGITHDLRGGYSVQPFVRGQTGRLQSGNSSAGVAGLSGGLTLYRRF